MKAEIPCFIHASQIFADVASASLSCSRARTFESATASDEAGINQTSAVWVGWRFPVIMTDEPFTVTWSSRALGATASAVPFDQTAIATRPVFLRDVRLTVVSVLISLRKFTTNWYGLPPLVPVTPRERTTASKGCTKQRTRWLAPPASAVRVCAVKKFFMPTSEAPALPPTSSNDVDAT